LSPPDSLDLPSFPLCHKQLAAPLLFWQTSVCVSWLDDYLTDEVEPGGVTVPVVPAVSWRSSLPHTVTVIMAPAADSGIRVHTVLVTLAVVRLTGSPGCIPAVGAYFAPCTDPRPSVFDRHVVSARPDISAAPVSCNRTPLSIYPTKWINSFSKNSLKSRFRYTWSRS